MGKGVLEMTGSAFQAMDVVLALLLGEKGRGSGGWGLISGRAGGVRMTGSAF